MTSPDLAARMREAALAVGPAIKGTRAEFEAAMAAHHAAANPAAVLAVLDRLDRAPEVAAHAAHDAASDFAEGARIAEAVAAAVRAALAGGEHG